MPPYRLITAILAISVVVFLLTLDLPTLLQPVPISVFRDVKGGSWLGYRLGYFGTIIIILAQLYTVVKSLPFKRAFRWRSTWLKTHIYLSGIGSALVLIHSGLPFSFKYVNPFKYIDLFLGLPAGLVGFSGLATWILGICVLSGLIGRYLYTRVRVLAKPFRYWRAVHIWLTISLYISGLIHIILVVLFKMVV